MELLKKFDTVLSLELCDEYTKNETIDVEIQELIEKRTQAKKNKDYDLADKIRDDLMKKGIKLIDTREGTSYEYIKD